MIKKVNIQFLLIYKMILILMISYLFIMQMLR